MSTPDEGLDEHLFDPSYWATGRLPQEIPTNTCYQQRSDASAVTSRSGSGRTPEPRGVSGFTRQSASDGSPRCAIDRPPTEPHQGIGSAVVESAAGPRHLREMVRHPAPNNG